MEDSTFLTMPVLMAYTMVGLFVQAIITAEEKEKQTLRVLMLSPATGAEVLIGKGVMTFTLTASPGHRLCPPVGTVAFR